MLRTQPGTSYTRPITACRPQALKLAKQARCSLLTAQDVAASGCFGPGRPTRQRNGTSAGAVPRRLAQKGTYTAKQRSEVLGTSSFPFGEYEARSQVSCTCHSGRSPLPASGESVRERLSLSLSPQHHRSVICAANAGYFYNHRLQTAQCQRTGANPNPSTTLPF